MSTELQRWFKGNPLWFKCCFSVEPTTQWWSLTWFHAASPGRQTCCVIPDASSRGRQGLQRPSESLSLVEVAPPPLESVRSLLETVSKQRSSSEVLRSHECDSSHAVPKYWLTSNSSSTLWPQPHRVAWGRPHKPSRPPHSVTWAICSGWRREAHTQSVSEKAWKEYFFHSFILFVWFHQSEHTLICVCVLQEQTTHCNTRVCQKNIFLKWESHSILLKIL